MEILLIALLTVLNGIFAMSEMALASSRKARLVALAEAGDEGAAAALRLMDHPTRFLSTVQVGITSIGILNGIVGEAAFSGSLARWMQGYGVGVAASGYLATGIVVAIITYVTIIFGELVPKRIAQVHPEAVSRWISRPMSWLSRAAGPFVALLTKSTQAVLKLLGIDTTQGRGMTEEEITHSLEEGVDAGVIEEHEHQMVRNLFHLDDRPLTSMMVPRSDIEWLEGQQTVAECLHQVGREGAHSWYPVCRGSLEDVIGVVSVSRLLALGPQDPTPVEAIATPAVFVPETLSGTDLVEQFRQKSGRMVFVVDEYGVVQGLMTPHDLLEAITGELRSEVAADAWATQREDGAWALDGTMPISELKARLDIRELPDEDRGRYNTVAGLLMSVSGSLPAAGERIECGEWLFEVTALDGKRIDTVVARRQAAPGEPQP